MEGLRWQLFDTYGPRARIIRAERIQTGGLFGLGATTSFEVTVEVDGAGTTAIAKDARAGTVLVRPQPRRGLAGLLADADGADDAGAIGGSVVVPVNGGAPDFGAILDRMAGNVGDWPADLGPVADVPRPSTLPGDLVVLVGLADQPLRTAWTMIRARKGGAELRTAGEHRSDGTGHLLIDSPEVKKVQALAAVDAKPLIIAFSIGKRGSSSPSALAAVRADQLWLVVDAAHKPEDTQAWVRQVAWHAVPDALAVHGSTYTATPETVNELGCPVGWVDGYQSTSPVL